MKPRFTDRYEHAVRIIPYVLSLSAITFAVACGKGDNKQSVALQAPQAQTKTTPEEKMLKIYHKTDLANPGNLDLAQRIEGGTVEIETADTETNSYDMFVSLVIRSSTSSDAAKKSSVLQVHARGKIVASLADDLTEAGRKNDRAVMTELNKRSYLTVSELDSSPEAKGLYRVQAFCLDNECKNLGVRVLEADAVTGEAAAEAEGQEIAHDETRVRRQVSIRFVRSAEPAAEDLMNIESYNTTGLQDKSIAEALSQKTFAEAAAVREKDGSLSPSARDAETRLEKEKKTEESAAEIEDLEVPPASENPTSAPTPASDSSKSEKTN